jgi:ERCC4-type nuclease
MHPVKILADVHEPQRVVEAIRKLGVAVAVGALEAGDYEVARGVVVERKSVLDLHESIRVGRFWSQVGKLRRTALRPYLLLEGRSLFEGPIRSEAIRGVVLAVLDLGIPVLGTTGIDDTALWLRRLAVRSQQTRPPARRPSYVQRPRSPSPPAEAMLASVPGISVGTARALLARFGSIADLAQAGPEEWASVPGVGAVRRRALESALMSRSRALPRL